MRLRTTCPGEILARTRRNWPVRWPGDLDVRDEFRNRVFPIDFSKFSVGQRIFVFLGIVAKFRNKERSVGIGDTGKLVWFKEFVFDEVDVTDF